MVSPSDSPTAASEPCASPEALVPADAVWSALAVNDPLMASGVAFGSTVAVVVTFDSAIATAGVTATSPPAAPVFALTLSRCCVDALIVRSAPPTSVPVIDAVVVSSTRPTATDAPMPTPTVVLLSPGFGRRILIFQTPRPCVPM